MKKRALLVSLSLIVILALNAFAVDLMDFPAMFLENIDENTVIIIGKSAQAEDVIGSIDIAVMLQKESKSGKTIDIAKFDTEISDISLYNSIVVGGPCVNSVAAKLMNYPKNCLEGFETGKAIIKLYGFKNGNSALVVAGTAAADTRRATYVLSNYNEYNLTGTETTIVGIDLNELRITKK